MKQLLTINLCIGLILTFVFACSKGDEQRGESTPEQTGRSTPEQRGRFTPEQRVERLTEQLDLSSDQAEKIKQILTDSQDKFVKLREDFSGDRSEMREPARAIMAETDSLIKEVLNKEQIEKYEQYQQERRERGWRGPRERNRD